MNRVGAEIELIPTYIGVESAESIVKTEKLQQTLAFADQMTSAATYLDPSKNQQSTRWEQFVFIREYVRQFVTAPKVIQDTIDQAVFLLTCGIEETGQRYVEGGIPVSFKSTNNGMNGVNLQILKEALVFADQIIDAATYVDPSLNDHNSRWGQFVAFKGDAHRIAVDAEASQVEVDQAIWLLNYGIEIIGQKYVTGAKPVMYQ